MERSGILALKYNVVIHLFHVQPHPHNIKEMLILLYVVMMMWSETPAHGFYAEIHVSTYAAGGQLTPNP